MSWKRGIEPWARPALQGWGRLRRGMTLGVRGLVQDGEGRVLLIEHTYVHGWYFPGGGVERGETAELSLAREMEEEAGVRITGRPRLLSVHDNGAGHPGDHVLFYRVTDWVPCPATSKGEISQVGWFAPDALPEGITRGTRRRLEEALNGTEPDPLW